MSTFKEVAISYQPRKSNAPSNPIRYIQEKIDGLSASSCMKKFERVERLYSHKWTPVTLANLKAIAEKQARLANRSLSRSDLAEASARFLGSARSFEKVLDIEKQLNGTENPGTLSTYAYMLSRKADTASQCSRPESRAAIARYYNESGKKFLLAASKHGEETEKRASLLQAAVALQKSYAQYDLDVGKEKRTCSGEYKYETFKEMADVAALLGRTLTRLGKKAEAAVAFENVISAIQDGVIFSSRTPPDLRKKTVDLLAQSYVDLGGIQSSLGEHEKAASSYYSAEDIYVRRAKKAKGAFEAAGPDEKKKAGEEAIDACERAATICALGAQASCQAEKSGNAKGAYSTQAFVLNMAHEIAVTIGDRRADSIRMQQETARQAEKNVPYFFDKPAEGKEPEPKG